MEQSNGYGLHKPIEKFYCMECIGLETKWDEDAIRVSPGSVNLWHGAIPTLAYLNDAEIVVPVRPEWRGKQARILVETNFSIQTTRIRVEIADEDTPPRWDDERQQIRLDARWM